MDNKVPTILQFLTDLTIKEGTHWDVWEDQAAKIVTIETTRVLTDIEKAKIERYGFWYGGPAKYVFKAILEDK